METTFLYTLNCPLTGKIRYLGKSDNPFHRYYCHLQRVHQGKSHKSSWILGLQKRGLVPHMELLDEVPKSEWKFWEKEYIRVFRAIGIRLTNIADGGEGTSLPGEKNPFWGRVHSEETREKIRAARKLQIFSEESRQKRISSLLGKRNHFFGKKHSPETKEKIKQKLAGRKVSPEALENRRKSLESRGWI